MKYSSLVAIFDVIGISNEQVRETVLLLMEIYSPLAFTEAMGAAVAVSSRVNIVERHNPRPYKEELPDTADQALKKKAYSQVDRALLLANTSLLVPVVLALAICHVAFNALTHESDGLRSESAALRGERTEIVKALSSQNEKISTTVIRLEEFLASLIKGKVLEPTTPHRGARHLRPKPTSQV